MHVNRYLFLCHFGQYIVKVFVGFKKGQILQQQINNIFTMPWVMRRRKLLLESFLIFLMYNAELPRLHFNSRYLSLLLGFYLDLSNSGPHFLTVWNTCLLPFSWNISDLFVYISSSHFTGIWIDLVANSALSWKLSMFLRWLKWLIHSLRVMKYIFM